MKNKRGLEQLFKAIKDNPDAEVVFFYPDYGVEGLTPAKIYDVYVDEVVVYEMYGEELVFFRKKDFRRLVEYILEEEIIDAQQEEPTKEQEEEAIRRAKNLTWKKIIAVELDTTDI